MKAVCALPLWLHVVRFWVRFQSESGFNQTSCLSHTFHQWAPETLPEIQATFFFSYLHLTMIIHKHVQQMVLALNLVHSLREICFLFRAGSCYYVDFLLSCTWSEVLAQLVGSRWRWSMLFNPPGAICWMQNKPSWFSRKTLITQSPSVSFSNRGLDNSCLMRGEYTCSVELQWCSHSQTGEC